MKGREKALWLTPAVLGALLLFYLFVAWAVPYCITDDLQWGLDQGVRWWRYGLLNGRYVGNFFAMAMCHVELLKVLIMGAGMFAIPFLMAAILCRGEREKFLPLYLACNAGVLFMPSEIWVEVYGWVSGFGNYGLSVAVFLGFILLVRRTHEKRDRLKLRSAALFLLALVMGLFVENNSILFVGVALVLGVYAAIWDRELCLPYWAAFAGTVLAVAVMFSNGVTAQLTQTGSAINGLRELTFSWSDGPVAVVKGVLSDYLFHRIPGTFWEGPGMAVVLGLIIALGFWNSRLPALAVLGAAPPAVWYWLSVTGLYGLRPNCYAVCLCWALAFLALAVHRCEWRLKVRRLLLYLAAPLSLVPVAATWTAGKRFYFFPMVVFVMVAADLAAPLLSKPIGRGAAGAALAAVMLLLGVRAAAVGGCNVLQARQIRQAVAAGEDRVVLPEDRFVWTFWMVRTAWTPEYAWYFRDFYGIPEDVTLVFLPPGSYETWPDCTEEQWAQRVEMEPTGPVDSSLP